MVLRSTAAHGRRHGLATAVGVNTGALVWGAAAAVGISALLTASTIAYTILRVAGAAYMIWMGHGSSCTQHLAMVAFQSSGPDTTQADQSLARSWSRGLTTNLLNPKIGAFYVAILPQFIPAHESHLAVGLLLAFVHDIEGLTWFSAIILGVHSVRKLLARRGFQRSVDGITGGTLIGFGLKLGLSSK